MNPEILKKGGIAVIPSDTLYGIMGSALLPETVDRIYELRGRDRTKPMIVLISDPDELSRFGITPTPEEIVAMKKYWPGAVTIALMCPAENFEYLHRGTNSIAFRVPKNPELRELLKETGPLVAPSANTEGNSPARTADEAKIYFGDAVQLYVDGGWIEGMPSTLIQVEHGKIRVLRHGVVDIDETILS